MKPNTNIFAKLAAAVMGLFLISAVFTVSNRIFSNKQYCAAAYSPCPCNETACEENGCRASLNSEANVCASRDIFDLIKPETVDFYETNIAGEKLISDIEPALLARTAAKFGISTNKYVAVVLLRDLAFRTGDDLDIKKLAAMRDGEIVYSARNYIQKYADSLSEEQKEALKKNYRESCGNSGLLG